MEKNWVCIFTTDLVYEAELAKEVLFDHGIQAVTINKKDSNYLFGAIEMYVDRKHVLRAKHLMENFNTPNSPTCE